MMRKELLPFVWTPDEDEKKTKLDKRTFKICEAVALGIGCYYLEKWKPIILTPEDKALARKIIPTLPEGWMQGADNLPWSCMNKKKNKRKH